MTNKNKIFGEFFILKGRIKKLIKNMPQSKQDLILDIGCGDEPYYHKLLKGKIIAIDIKKSKTTDIICDSHNVALKKEKFDKVICVNSFYYFSNPFKTVEEIKRVLKKDGKLIMVMPFIYPIHDVPIDKYRFTEYGIKNLLKNDFKIEKIKTIGGIFSLPSVIFHSMLKGLPLFIILYPFYILTQLLSILDFLDFSNRWPIYYFVLSSKK